MGRPALVTVTITGWINPSDNELHTSGPFGFHSRFTSLTFISNKVNFGVYLPCFVLLLSAFTTHQVIGVPPLTDFTTSGS